MNKNKVYKRLRAEAERANMTQVEFAKSLDQAATPRIGTAYAFGLITAAHTETYNKETVCRYIRQWRLEQRHKAEQA